MRRPFTTAEAARNGLSIDALKWAVKSGAIQRVLRGVYVHGSAPPTAIESAIAYIVSTDGVASYSLAGALLGLDGVRLTTPYVTTASRKRANNAIRFRKLSREDVMQAQGYRCTTGLRTLEDLAMNLNADHWEQAMESALRKRLVTVAELEASKSKRVQQAMASRPNQAPPTESLLETLMVQLIRGEPSLPTPTRQVEIFNKWDRFVARVDLAWPEFGVFLELDGQQHKDQPIYDANRQTAVVASTGWLVGRFTWHEVNNVPRLTIARLLELFEQASTLRQSA